MDLKSLAIVVLTAVVLVLGFDYATLASTGDSLIMGKANSAAKITKVTRTTSGPALQLKTKSDESPPFTANGKGKVKNLNADELDGVDAQKLGVRPIVFTKVTGAHQSGSTYRFGLPGVPAGGYLVNLNLNIQGAGFADCDIWDLTDDKSLMMVLDHPGGYSNPGVVGAGYITVKRGHRLALSCYAESGAGGWGASPGNPWVVALSPSASTISKAMSAPASRPGRS